MIRRRVGWICGAVVLSGLLLGGQAYAAPTPHGNAKGFLQLSENGSTISLPPGQAIKTALADCEGTGASDTNAGITVDQIRAAFPAPVTVCTGITLTSQVGADNPA